MFYFSKITCKSFLYFCILIHANIYINKNFFYAFFSKFFIKTFKMLISKVFQLGLWTIKILTVKILNGTYFNNIPSFSFALFSHLVNLLSCCRPFSFLFAIFSNKFLFYFSSACCHNSSSFFFFPLPMVSLKHHYYFFPLFVQQSFCLNYRVNRKSLDQIFTILLIHN